VNRRERIAIRCECGNARLIERANYEPDAAVETLHSQCTLCEDGGFGVERHFDRDGKEVEPVE
jgi:hypothetical protein